jgi:hypothetical protein
MKELRIVCRFPPRPYDGHGRFIEAQDETGKSVRVGRWREREDGLWELIIVVDTLR